MKTIPNPVTPFHGRAFSDHDRALASRISPPGYQGCRKLTSIGNKEE